MCKLRGVKRAEVMSIEDLVFEANLFAAILMLGNNFSLFCGFKKARRLLKKLNRITF